MRTIMRQILHSYEGYDDLEGHDNEHECPEFSQDMKQILIYYNFTA